MSSKEKYSLVKIIKTDGKEIVVETHPDFTVMGPDPNSKTWQILDPNKGIFSFNWNYIDFIVVKQMERLKLDTVIDKIESST